MKYRDTGFRALYQNYVALPLVERLKDSMTDYPDANEANCLLAYGYIDRAAGLTLEVLAAGVEDEEGFSFFDAPDSVRFSIRIGAAEELDFSLLDDGDGRLASRYKSKVEILESYEADEEVEESRKMRFLDGCRHPHFPDDVQVYLVRESFKPELCWARIIGLQDHCIVGSLLNEPNQDFGYHRDETIAFFVNETDDGELICVSDMNPSALLTPEDLEDGTLLKDAIAAFNANRTERGFIDILEILRDSWVWIPCNAVLEEVDQQAIADLIDAAGEDPSSLIGAGFTTQGSIRLVPDVLQKGGELFFPVFAAEEDMGEYGAHFSKMQKHFLDAIALARNNEKDVSGIVVNAFTEPWVLDREAFDIVERMKTRLVTDKA